MENQPIVFSYFHNNEFMGFRADTFNTISKDHPKIYTYSREQVDTVVSNVKSGCNNAGRGVMQALKVLNPIAQTLDETTINMDTAIDHVSKTELTFREWKEFEVRVLSFVSRDEWNDLGEGDEWKKNQISYNLMYQPALEVYKFKVVDNEN